jgi:Ca2+-binding RTX toxin-like protein
MANIPGTVLSDDGVAAPALVGTIFADVLNSNWSAGNDTMSGGAGNDVYNVNSGGDLVIEAAGQGIDTVVSRAATHTLGFNVENLTLDNNAALTAFNGFGNTLANVIVGNDNANVLAGRAGNDTIDGGAGNDWLYGEAGADTTIGGSGNDFHFVDNVADVVIEAAVAGEIDHVFTSVSDTLDANVENLTLVNVATAINGTGNASHNVINGNGFNNTLSGLAGDDVLAGGAGVDTLTGGAQQDQFQFADRGVANADTITDFSHADDSIALMNALDVGLAGAVTPGVLGLAFVGGNVAGNALSTGWFFKGAGLDGDGAQLSGIFVNTNTGQLWYNPTSGTVGDSQFLGTVNAGAIAALDSSDFVYG